MLFGGFFTWARDYNHFFKVKVTLTSRQVVLRHDNLHLMIIFFDLDLCLTH